MNALEEAGFDYEDQVINIMNGEQKSPKYLAVHRSGKVPALQMDDQVITENASIIYFLHNQKPEAGILPFVQSDNPPTRRLFYSRRLTALYISRFLFRGFHGRNYRAECSHPGQTQREREVGSCG